jgi:hypothetical protein
MNRKTTFALAAGSALALLLAATPAEAGPGRIANRESRQQARIADGVASGSLTPRETARLEGREAALDRSIARMKSDGSLSPGERLRIEKRQDRISRGIYRQKHDAQGR